MRASRQRIGRRQRAAERSRLAWSPQHVARAADRVEDARLAAGLELAPQVGDEHVDGVRLGERRRSPRPRRAGAARETTRRSLRIRYSSSSNSRGGELERALAAEHLVRVGVQAQVADDQRRAAARRAAAQQGAQAGEQLLALERLDEVVVGAGVEALDARLEPSRAVSIRIGTSPSSRRRRHTSTPSSFGRPRSSTTASGSNDARPRSSAASPSLGEPHLVALQAQRAAQHAARSRRRPRRRAPCGRAVHAHSMVGTGRGRLPSTANGPRVEGGAKRCRSQERRTAQAPPATPKTPRPTRRARAPPAAARARAAPARPDRPRRWSPSACFLAFVFYLRLGRRPGRARRLADGFLYLLRRRGLPGAGALLVGRRRAGAAADAAGGRPFGRARSACSPALTLGLAAARSASGPAAVARTALARRRLLRGPRRRRSARPCYWASTQPVLGTSAPTSSFVFLMLAGVAAADRRVDRRRRARDRRASTTRPARHAVHRRAASAIATGRTGRRAEPGMHPASARHQPSRALGPPEVEPVVPRHARRGAGARRRASAIPDLYGRRRPSRGRAEVDAAGGPRRDRARGDVAEPACAGRTPTAAGAGALDADGQPRAPAVTEADDLDYRLPRRAS